MTPRLEFNNELDVLNHDLTKMCLLIEAAIDRVILAFQKEDYIMAQEIINGDRNINDMEHTIESKCLSIILRQQPVAKDLRVVSTALKVVTDMERIGDHAADISELIIKNRFSSNFHMVTEIPKMAEVAKEMVHESLQSFIDCNLELAKKVIKMDDVVDDYFNQIKQSVIEALKTSGEKADSYIDVLMIAKYMERIGDHAVNICEWAQFHETGEVNNFRLL